MGDKIFAGVEEFALSTALFVILLPFCCTLSNQNCRKDLMLTLAIFCLTYHHCFSICCFFFWGGGDMKEPLTKLPRAAEAREDGLHEETRQRISNQLRSSLRTVRETFSHGQVFLATYVDEWFTQQLTGVRSHKNTWARELSPFALSVQSVRCCTDKLQIWVCSISLQVWTSSTSSPFHTLPFVSSNTNTALKSPSNLIRGQLDSC